MMGKRRPMIASSRSFRMCVAGMVMYVVGVCWLTVTASCEESVHMSRNKNSAKVREATRRMFRLLLCRCPELEFQSERPAT